MLLHLESILHQLGVNMKALRWYGKEDVRVESVADPVIRDPRDILLKITSTAICGSDLHLYNGLMPTMGKATCSAMNPWEKVVEGVPRLQSLRLEIVWSCLSPSRAANASSARKVCSPCATDRSERGSRP